MTPKPARIGQFEADESLDAPKVIHIQAGLQTPSQGDQRWALVLQLLGRPSYITFMTVKDSDDGEQILTTLHKCLLQIPKPHWSRMWFQTFYTAKIVGTAEILRVGWLAYLRH